MTNVYSMWMNWDPHLKKPKNFKQVKNPIGSLSVLGSLFTKPQ